MRRETLTKIACFVFCFLAISCDKKPVTVNVEANSPEIAALIKEAVVNAYPSLPPDQQKLIRDGLVFTVYDEAGPISNYATAFGPEDDPQYRYPDRALYPRGTIKVNLCSSFLRLLSARQHWGDGAENSPSGSDLDINSYRVAKIRIEIVEVIAHEIKHVQQYMQKPVHALNEAEQCPNGLCDETRTEDTRIKMEYEFAAMVFGYNVSKNAAVKNGLEPLLRKQPMPDRVRFFYSSMYEPIILAQKCALVGALDEEEKKEARSFISYNSENDSELEIMYPHLTPVFQRLESCLK